MGLHRIDYLILFVLAVLLVLALFNLVRRKKSGRSTCSGCCDGCLQKCEGNRKKAK